MLSSISELPDLDRWIKTREAEQPGLKEDNDARIVWAHGAAPAVTPVSVVYLHGLTASPGECGDLPQRLAERFDANVFLARLPGHGLQAEDAMRGLTAEKLIATAEEALVIGRAIGERVVLLGSSVGATLNLTLAARHPDAIAAVVCWSPGVRPRDPGLLAQLAASGDTVLQDPRPRSDAQLRYWSASVHADAYRSLQQLFDQEMTPATFARVRAPLFMAYFFRDEDDQDPAASVEAMRSMFDQLGTPQAMKRSVAFAEGTHVIASPYRSQVADQVFNESVAFLDRALAS